jgi:hypothetical protein
MKSIKIFSVFFIILLIANIILFSTKIINAFAFWAIIGASALFVYFGMPYMKEENK